MHPRQSGWAIAEFAIRSLYSVCTQWGGLVPHPLAVIRGATRFVSDAVREYSGGGR
jgi:hypothetical protein